MELNIPMIDCFESICFEPKHKNRLQHDILLEPSVSVFDWGGIRNPVIPVHEHGIVGKKLVFEFG